MLPNPRPEILAIPEAVHGTMETLELERLGIDRESIIDFSVNVNPFGASPHAKAALSRVCLDRYPDREAQLLRRELARNVGIAEEHLIAGNGSGELLSLIALTYVRPGDDVLEIGPTYAEYSRSAMAMGGKCVHYVATADTSFAIRTEEIVELFSKSKPRVAYLCNPNNPTGQFVPPKVIEAWTRAFDQTLFVIDEAFIEYVANSPSMVRYPRRNVVVLRSFTKAFGLAGLRLGYLVGNPDVVRMLCRARCPWSVNAAAQEAGIAAIRDVEHLKQTMTRLAASKQTLVAELESLGLKPLRSATPFFLVPVTDASRVRRELLVRSQILVRDCTSFGLPGFIRIGVRNLEDNSKLVNAIASIRP